MLLLLLVWNLALLCSCELIRFRSGSVWFVLPRLISHSCFSSAVSTTVKFWRNMKYWFFCLLAYLFRLSRPISRIDEPLQRLPFLCLSPSPLPFLPYMFQQIKSQVHSHHSTSRYDTSMHQAVPRAANTVLQSSVLFRCAGKTLRKMRHKDC